MCHMDVTSFFKITVLGFLVVGTLAGCQHPSTTATVPTRLACLIADTDHIVVTFRPPGNHPVPPPDRYRDFSLVISGDEARKIVRDVSAMHDGFPNFTDSIWCWELRFYRGRIVRPPFIFHPRRFYLRGTSILVTPGHYSLYHAKFGS
jgi:hypothetical protein